MATVNYSYSPNFAPGIYNPVFDPNANNPNNLVTQEIHTITAETQFRFQVIIPLFGPFYETDFIMVYTPNGGSPITLVPKVDYLLVYNFLSATRSTGFPVYGGIQLTNNTLEGTFTIQYRTIGGDWVLSQSDINQVLANQLQQPKTTSWENVINLPYAFPVTNHNYNIVDMVGAAELVNSIDDLAQTIANKDPDINAQTTIDNHLLDINNPHQTTKSQVGLGNVENYGVANSTEAINSSVNNKYMTPKTTNDVIQNHKNEADPHPNYTTNTEVTTLIEDKINELKNETNPFTQYSTDTEITNKFNTLSFKGCYLGIATYNAIDNVYEINTSLTITNNAVIAIKFPTTNLNNVSLKINTTTYALVDSSLNPILEKEIIKDEIRLLCNNGTSYSLLDQNKYVYNSFDVTSFINVDQNDVVRLNNGILDRAIANDTPPDNLVIGIADKQNLKVVYGGILGGFSGLTPDTIYYLSPTLPGKITTTKPFKDAIKIGIAISTTELIVDVTAAPSNDTMPTGGNGDKIFFVSNQIINNDFTIKSTQNALLIGPVTQASGSTVTVESGATVVIL